MKNCNLNETRQLTDTSTDMTNIFELSNDDFRAAISKTNQNATVNTTKTNGKTESHSKDTKITQNQMGILELKNTIAKIKFNGWIQQQDGNNKEKIDINASELKD